MTHTQTNSSNLSVRDEQLLNKTRAFLEYLCLPVYSTSMASTAIRIKPIEGKTEMEIFNRHNLHVLLLLCLGSTMASLLLS